MRKEKFTQGEWKIVETGLNYYPDIKIECNGDSVCCEIHGNDHGKPNAHLIKAAPKMYHLLEDAMCLLAENDNECKALSKQIRFLRAEARGES